MTKKEARERRRQERNEEDLIKGILGFILLGGFYLAYQFKTNPANFWPIILWAIVVVVVVTLGIFGYIDLRNLLHAKKIERLVGLAKGADVEQDFRNFILRFGLDKGPKSESWKFRNYEFDDSRMNDFVDILAGKGMQVDVDQVWLLLKHYIQEMEFGLTKDSVVSKPKDLDSLSGSEFENLLQRLYTAAGYRVQMIGGVGDQGGDLIANKEGQRLLIQAKRYSGSVGNAAVQEAVAAKTHYDCTDAVVATTGVFTREAVALAKTNRVVLFGRQEIQKRLMELLKESWK
jgi:hypothetical protein